MRGKICECYWPIPRFPEAVVCCVCGGHMKEPPKVLGDKRPLYPPVIMELQLKVHDLEVAVADLKQIVKDQQRHIDNAHHNYEPRLIQDGPE